MRHTNIDKDWELMEGQPSSIPGMPKQTKTVNLPHDFMIEGDVTPDAAGGADSGYYHGAAYTYTKEFVAPEDWNGKEIMISFDGVYGETQVLLNGCLMGKHSYGYTPFTVNLEKKLYFGRKNRLQVVVSNDAEPNCRWYSGGGIYRHVELLAAPKVHIAPKGIFAYTSHMVDGDAFVIVETTVENHTAEDCNVWAELHMYRLLDTGKTTLEEEPGIKASGAVKVHVPAGESRVARTQLCVERAAIWDVDDPNLYVVKAVLYEAVPKGETLSNPNLLSGKALSKPHSMKMLDTEKTQFGIRTISLDSKHGFRLNGRTLKLKGGCIHHDNGILGAASFADSEYRKVKLHKDNGYNALRFAHNPVSSDMLDACDRLGMVVIDEAFDTWNLGKNLHDFSEHFADQWEMELTSFVLRDRNHPSVIVWSIGNELREQGGLADGYRISQMIADEVRKLDSTRFVGGALCSFFAGLDDEDTGKFWQSLMQEAQLSGGSLANLDGSFGRSVWNDYTEAFCAPWDMVGYNYLNYHYDEALELFPNRVICATESKPRQMEEYWDDVLRLPNLIGDFEWTSHDYIGEAGIGKRFYVEPEQAQDAGRMMHTAPFPWRTAGAGEFDLCGFAKPQLAYRRIIWGSDETYITVKNPANFGKTELLDRYAWNDCANSWTWQAKEGTPMEAEVYSSADEVELLLNGEVIGREKAGKENHNKACFTLSYRKGTLKAVSYTDGKAVSWDEIASAGVPAGLKITMDPAALHQNELPADGQSLAFAVVEVVDAEENPVPYAEVVLTAEVEGQATLAAFGTGRCMTDENYTAGKIKTFEGKALAVIRAGYEAGTSTLTVKAEGFSDAVMEINLTNC